MTSKLVPSLVFSPFDKNARTKNFIQNDGCSLNSTYKCRSLFYYNKGLLINLSNLVNGNK